MAQINIKKSTSFVIPNENCRAYGFDALGNPVYVDEQGLAYSLSSNSPSSNNSSNIVANRGVGLESELPVTAIVGDIYVSTDTFKVFQALNATEWQTDLLTTGVLITDTNATLIIVYQFLNNNLHTISGPEVFTDETLEISKNEDVTAITTLRDVLKNTSNYFIQSGAVITDNGDNTISITEAQAWVKTDIADNSEFRAVKIAAKDLTIEADKNILIYINYNAGQATFEQTESTPGFFYSYYNKIPFATCVNIGDSIIVNNFAEVGRNSVYKNTLSQINYQAFRYIEGLGTVSNVSRNVLTSPGVVIFANEGMTIAGLNTSSGGSFTRLYYDDGAWERIAGQTVIDNENYNDVATGLAVIPNNKYAKKYLYYVKSLVDYYIVIEGQMAFDDLATAKTANLPAVLPPEISNYYAGALLVAVFIVKEGEAEIIEIQNPFKQPFSSQAASNHDNLSGLTNAASEGAVNGHLTNAQYYALENRQLLPENIEGIKTFNSNIVLNERGGFHSVTGVCTSISLDEGFGIFTLNDTAFNYELIKFIQQTQGRGDWDFSFSKEGGNVYYDTFIDTPTPLLLDFIYNSVNYKLAIIGLVHGFIEGVYTSMIGGILYETDGVTPVDIKLLPVDVPLTFSYDFPFINTTVTNVPTPINNSDAANKAYVDDIAQPAIECTYIELKALRNSNSLVVGSFYKIAYGLDYTSPAAGQYILMQALSTNEIAVHGSRMMLCPRQYYQGTDSDNNVWLGVWNSSLTPAIGELVVWGGKVYENLTGNVGTSHNFLYLDQTDWTPIHAHEATNNQYIPLYFEITLQDWVWSSEYPPRVSLQRDGKNNIVRYSSEVIDDFYGIPFSDWNGYIGENNEALIIVNNTTSVLRNNKVTGELVGNTCGVYENNIFGSILNNTCTGYINGNTNKGNISNNSNRDIYGNNNTGNITNNSIIGDIFYNRNNGNIHGNTSSIEVYIGNNMNNGDISGAERTTDVFDTPVNK